jgi:hypothetical protein
MFNPEFRYLLVQEERNGDMMPFIDKHLFAAIFVCGINFVILFGICHIAYELFSYTGVFAKYLWIALWNSLTPGHQWLDLAVIITGIGSSVAMFTALTGIFDTLDNGFTRLKNELNKKDERIRELEEKLKEVENQEISEVANEEKGNEKSETFDKKDDKNEESVIKQEEEAKKLEEWFSRPILK